MVVISELSRSLRSFGFELTTRCNYRCLHCFVRDYRGDAAITSEAVARLLPALDAMGFGQVYLTGGEPLLNPQFVAIYRLLREKGFLTTVYSNGSILRPEHVAVFRSLPPHLYEVTLYGASDAAYRTMTGARKQFSRVRRNLDTLQLLGVPLVVKFQLLRETVDDLSAYMAIAREYESEIHVSAQTLPRADGSLDPLGHRLSPDEVARAELRYGIPFVPGRDERHRCDAGRTMYMDADGVVHGCPVLNTSIDRALGDEVDVLGCLSDMDQSFVGFREELGGRPCPAWVALEGATGVQAYIDDAREALASLSHDESRTSA